MKTEKTKEQRKILDTILWQDWAQIPTTTKMISHNGQVFHNGKIIEAKRLLTFKLKGKRWDTKKVILWAFKKIEPRGGYVLHKDGNKNNLHPDNLEYATPIPQLQTEYVNRPLLRLALRCYYNLNRNANPTHGEFTTRFCLATISELRQYHITQAKSPLVDLFCDWCANIDTPQLMRKYNLPIRQVQTAIAHHVNNLCAMICFELSHGLHELQPYHEDKQQQERKRQKELLAARGLKQHRATVVYFPKHLLVEFEKLGIAPPSRPDWGSAERLPKGGKLFIWLMRALDIAKENNAQELAAMIEAYASKLNFFSNETNIKL